MAGYSITQNRLSFHILLFTFIIPANAATTTTIIHSLRSPLFAFSATPSALSSFRSFQPNTIRLYIRRLFTVSNNFPKGQVAIQQLSPDGYRGDLMSEASNLTISSIALCPMPFALCSQRPALCVQLSYLFIPAIHK